MDCTVAAFDIFLRVIYHKLDAMDMANIDHVINLAENYECDGVMDICKNYLLQNVNAKNVCFVWPLAFRFSGWELVRTCQIITKTEWKTVINSDIFIETDWDTFDTIFWYVPNCDRIKKGIIERFMEWARGKH